MRMASDVVGIDVETAGAAATRGDTRFLRRSSRPSTQTPSRMS